MRITTAVLLSILLTACGGGGGEPAAVERSDGRDETRGIRNTEAIGYAGDAVADRVDGALNANDQRRQQLDAELEEME